MLHSVDQKRTFGGFDIEHALNSENVGVLKIEQRRMERLKRLHGERLFSKDGKGFNAFMFRRMGVVVLFRREPLV